MELEEAIKEFKREYDDNKICNADLIISLETAKTILNYIDNSISKKKVEEKYKFYKSKLDDIRKSNIEYNNATKYDYLIVGRKDAYEELLED